MAFLSKERTYGILNGIANAECLDHVLDLLGAEIELLGLANGYLINLLDASGKQLTSMKIRYMPEFQNLEKTYLGYTIPLNDGHLNDRTVASRQIVRITMANASEAEAEILRYWKICELIGVPIYHPENAALAPLGTIILLKQDSPVAANELVILQQLLGFFYKSLAGWLRLSHLEEMHDEATAAVEENKRLLQFLDEMNNLTSVDKIYDLFAAELFRQFPFDFAAFYLQENGYLHFQRVIVADSSLETVAHEWEECMRAAPLPLTGGSSGATYVFSSNEPLLFPDVAEIMHLPMAESDVKSLAILKTARTLLLAPIRYQKNPIGILSLYSLHKPAALSEADRHLLDRLSSFLGTAISNGRIYATSQAQNLEIGHLNQMLQEKVTELAEQASTDQLTGLYNFRVFEREIVRRLGESNRISQKNELSLLLIDVDHFKNFNDTYGHAAGNQILAGMAREIGRHIRQMDMACRYGGEEFVLILPKCDPEGASLLAERIRSGVESSVFDTCAGQRSITISIGCTTYLPGDSQQSLFTRADEALYRAKNTGRNRVCSQ